VAWRVMGGYVVEIAGGSCEGGKKMDMEASFFPSVVFSCVLEVDHSGCNCMRQGSKMKDFSLF
jgi:hypothetical protein